MAHKKPNLSTRVCVTCGRPFTWRRKWAAVWHEVRHCSNACRARRRPDVTSPDVTRPGRDSKA